MTRALLVTCSRRGCKATGQAPLSGGRARSLPSGWWVLGYDYDPTGPGAQYEFCSLACLSRWAAETQAERDKNTERMAAPLPAAPKSKPAAEKPEGAML